MKKLLLGIICIVLLSVEFPIFVNGIFSNNYNSNQNFIQTSNNSYKSPIIYSKHVLILERSTGSILFEKSGFEKTPMASTTKIMTAIIAIENCNLNDEVKISSKAASTSGSTLGIKSNTTISLETLLYGLMLRSGNDCAVAIAEHISGDIKSFSILMNNKAKELNLYSTNFVTPHGLDSENHYTTAYDLARLTNYALNNKTFKKIVSTKKCTISINNSSREIINTHELLGLRSGIYGVKTGFTGNAGRCLVTACKKDDLDIIIVVLGSDTKKIRTNDTITLLDYAYANFKMVNIYKKLCSHFNNTLNYIPINNSNNSLETQIDQNSNFVFPINNYQNLNFKIFYFPNLQAPISKNQKVGKIKIYSNSYLLSEIDILAKNDIYKYKYNEIFFIIYKHYKNLFK